MNASSRVALRRLAGAVALALLAAPVAAQTILTHMRIEGLPGDGTLEGHANEIVLTGYSQSFDRKTCSRAVATKLIDRASPGLISRAAANPQIPQVVVTMTRLADPPFDFFRATLDQVTIERVELGEQADQLVEKVVLAPRSIRIEYINPAGGTPRIIASTFTCSG